LSANNRQVIGGGTVMAKGIYQKLAFAIAFPILSLATIETKPANAAIFTYDFTADITRGDFQGNSYKGFFSYDDSQPSSNVVPLQPYFAPSKLSFDFIGKTYTEGSLLYRTRYPSNPPLSYLTFSNYKFVIGPPNFLLPDGNLMAAKFLITDFNFIGFGSYLIDLNSDSTFSFLFADKVNMNFISSGGGTWRYTLRNEVPSTSVPEPSMLFGLSTLGLGWLLRKKKVN
jgi:hypothetical protein